MLNLGHARHDDAFEVGQHPAERFCLFRCPARQLPRHLTRFHLRLNRQLRNAGTVVRNPVDQLMTGGPELLRTHIEAPIPQMSMTWIGWRARTRLAAAGVTLGGLTPQTETDFANTHNCAFWTALAAG